MAQITMYPTKVEQPNRNKSSGLQGKCFKAVRRGGSTYEISCTDQRDPKYHHEWSNAEEILKGKTIQCGRPSTHMCSHATYYGIKGYRNTCPIAGVTGTYTQPATLRLHFDIKAKGVYPGAKIESVILTFQHRCTGVDVADGKEYFSWGPNFSGGKAYPSHKPLKIKFAGQTKIIEKNPPLGKEFNTIGNVEFKNVDYSDLSKGYIDVIYGNNLETNPGNIYVKGLKITVNYNDMEPYIEGTQNKKSIYSSDEPGCSEIIKFTIETGYKQGKKKVPTSKLPKNLQSLVMVDGAIPKGVTSVNFSYSSDKRTVYAEMRDNCNKTGDHKISFKIKGTKKKVSFKYKTVKRKKPTIYIPSQIERLTKPNGITSIIAKNGCTEKIEVFEKNLTNKIKEFTSFRLKNQENIIKESDIEDFWNILAHLSCGQHKLFFRIGKNTKNNVIEKSIKIVPTQYQFSIKEKNSSVQIYNGYKYKEEEGIKEAEIKFIPTKELLENPTFTIKNPTYGCIDETTGTVVPNQNADKTWNVSSKNPETLYIGLYKPGIFKIEIKDNDTSCPAQTKSVTINIKPKHKQYYDEIFVRGEDGTSFDYDYLVATEGDNLLSPLYVSSYNVGASYEDIKICTIPNKIIGLTKVDYIPFNITNTSYEDIKNLYLELNPLIENEDGEYVATSQEWLNENGIFYNFKEYFETYNSDYEGLVDIKNLEPDTDKIDEEDVLIHIKEIKAGKTINLKIPFSSYIEKNVQLQVLLFSQPLALWDLLDCTDPTKKFSSISLQVFDSTLTEMSITGETDLFYTTTGESPVGNCPEECFVMKQGITYKIMNIDTNTVTVPETTPTVKITNDPRLVAYKYIYKNQTKNITEPLPNNRFLSFKQNIEKEQKYFLRGTKLKAYVTWDSNHEEESFTAYTNYDGEVFFFIQIPTTISESFNTEELLKYMSIEFTGDKNHNPSVLMGDSYLGEKRSYSSFDTKATTTLTPIKTQTIYSPGQTITLKLQLTGYIKTLVSEIEYNPDISIPGSYDEITILYKICNLKDNEGILKTTFETNHHQLTPNKVSQDIYCGVDSDMNIISNLSKIIVENKTLNRLSLDIINKKRNNKDIKIKIFENVNEEKYEIINNNVEKGSVSIEDNNIYWNIPFLEKNTVTKGIIDFKATTIGFSTINITANDFIDDLKSKPGADIKFGKDSYKCICRKEVE